MDSVTHSLNEFRANKLKTNSVEPEPEDSSPRLRERATGPYPEPTEPTPHTRPSQSPHPPTYYALVFRVVSLL
jgi:hypothetical protein